FRLFVNNTVISNSKRRSIRMIRRHIGLICSLVVGFALLRLAFSQSDVGGFWMALSQARTDYLLWAFALIVLAYLIRGVRLPIWFLELSYGDSLALIFIGFMGNNILPGRLGELLRTECAAKKTGTGRTSSLASVAAERILDGVVLGLFGLAAIMLAPLGQQM